MYVGVCGGEVAAVVVVAAVDACGQSHRWCLSSGICPTRLCMAVTNERTNERDDKQQTETLEWLVAG